MGTSAPLTEAFRPQEESTEQRVQCSFERAPFQKSAVSITSSHCLCSCASSVLQAHSMPSRATNLAGSWHLLSGDNGNIFSDTARGVRRYCLDRAEESQAFIDKQLSSCQLALGIQIRRRFWACRLRMTSDAKLHRLAKQQSTETDKLHSRVRMQNSRMG